MKYFKKCFLLLLTFTFFALYLLNSLETIYSKSRGEVKLQCGRFPSEEHITIDNVIWQVLEIPKGLYKLMNAYLDERENRTIVRVSLIGDRLDIAKDEIYCQFWFDENPRTQPIVAKATQFVMMWTELDEQSKGAKVPFLVTCPIDFKHKIPKAVSLTAKTCDNAENKLEIIDNKPLNGVKKGFGVCSKSLSFDKNEFVIRFIEWVHMLRILGADKITIYNRYVHPELYKIMNYFHEKNFIDVKQFLEPSGVKTSTSNSQPTNMLEVMQHTDCFYRTRNLYDFIAVMDIDEVIVPMKSEDKTWHDLVKSFDLSKGTVSFLSLNAIIPKFETNNQPYPEIPAHNYMLQHTQRSKTTNGFVKSIIVPDKVVTLYSHFAQFCLDGDWCLFDNLPETTSLVFHYRNETINSTLTVEDKTMWKYKDELINAVALTLNETGFKP